MGLLEDNGSVLIDFALKLRLSNGFFDQVHFAAE